MLKKVVVIFICIFIGVGIFAFMESLAQFKTNKSLNWQIENSLKPQLARLQTDYAQLEKEKTAVVDELAKTKNAADALRQENIVIAQALNQKNSEFIDLQRVHKEKEQVLSKVSQQYSQLQSENVILKEKITSMFLELKALREAFSSEDELKEQIHSLRGDVKKKSSYEREPQFDESQPLQTGNRGYLTHNGKTTYAPKVKIRVTPIED